MKSDITQANQLYRSARYTQVIRILEPQVFKYRENFAFYYLLGMSCLRTGDAGGARTYLDRALSLKPHDAKSLAGLAVVHLKRYEITDAIQCYLDIVDNEPKHRLAHKGLKLLKRNADRGRLTPIIDSGRLDSLLPRERSYRRQILAFFVFIALAGVTSGYIVFRDQMRGEPREPIVTALSLDDLVLASRSYDSTFALTEKEIEQAFSDAKRYFADFRDNLSLREINRILRSNASEAVKEQARTIASFISPPDFTTISDFFSYDTVISDPTLYNGTYVVWRGRTSNVSIEDSRIRFDLLVGYDTNEVLEGVVSVELSFGVEISSGRPVEVLGEVNAGEGKLELTGISIHRLADR